MRTLSEMLEEIENEEYGLDESCEEIDRFMSVLEDAILEADNCAKECSTKKECSVKKETDDMDDDEDIEPEDESVIFNGNFDTDLDF